ncbi:Eco57I restriction-modification methylase domain-containing protein [Methylacidiphilum sp. Yel]|uniref:Eco57I restriction-modification methylase domain-containing protein n=1 Tax=Methylacidiphilum sp. Yel TaxID=1847730 RepID=UPI00106C0DAA|nr:N-6 DNA methylase [Methylacidiphilum sp. Yel]
MRARQERFTTVRTEGGVLPPDLLARVAAGDPGLPDLKPEAYHLDRGDRLNEAITRSWNRLLGTWRTFQEQLARLPEADRATGLTRERWLLPLFAELGYGRLAPARAVELDGKSYAVSHAWGKVPIHLLGWRTDLDRRERGVAGAAAQSPHGLLQELLNHSEERLYGFVSNGRVLRLLRDNTSLTRQAYVEFDLEAMFSGEVYADFAVLWLVCHVSRLEGEPPETCILERWREVAREQGVRALKALRGGVERALEALGAGFLAHPANAVLREDLRSGALDRQDYYRELLRLVYRLIFLFVAEDRKVLFDPGAPAKARDRYLCYYSTERLRRLAARRRDTRHGDLWEGLKVVMRALAAGAGAPGLALPALGSFLWSSQAIPHLEGAQLANKYLLAAVRALSEVTEGGIRRAVDYRNLGTEELGSVYESLLELHPEVNVDAATFGLKVEAGHERKTTGSYYTPSQLVQCLLNTTLEPVLVERTRAPDPEAAILSLKVLDPASGSGHFLVAAAHRIARRLAAVRTGDVEPSPEAVRQALRDVVSRCLYAVDVNEMAVELCKVSLWLETLDPGRPLSFLDAHIRRGNSLLGVTPAMLACGIPDAAYKEAHALEDKEACRALGRRNREERRRLEQGTVQLTLEEAAAERARELDEAARRLAEAPDDTSEALAAKEEDFRKLVASDAYRQAKLAADAWCAAFFLPKRKGSDGITTDTVRRLLESPDSVPEALRHEVERVASELAFFHWHLEFPEVFRVGQGVPENPEAGWSSGFDVVLGNPPWEQAQLSEKEFFATRDPDIAAAAGAERKRWIQRLRDDDPALYRAFLAATHQSEAFREFLAQAGRYPLTGRGKINTYAVFAETFRTLLAPSGKAGMVVPTGIATDATTQRFFADVVERRQLASLYDFENRKGLFPGVHRSYKFCLLTLTGALRPARAAEFAFFCHDAADLTHPERRFTLSPEDLRLVNPNTRTAPIFRSARDAELTRHIYRRIPVLVEEAKGEAGNPWGVSFSQGLFNMTSDSHLFRTRDQLEAEGYRLEGNVFLRGPERYFPLYEAKMVHQFDHRFGDYADQPPRSKDTQLPEVPLERLADPAYRVLPRYWVHEREVEARLRGRWDRGWLLGWREITNVTNERTVIAAVIPRVGVGHKYLLMLPTPPENATLLLTALDSLPFDYCARQKVGGTSLTYFTMKQLPVHPPEAFDHPCPWSPGENLADWIRPRVLELTYIAWDLEPFARDLGYSGPPFRYDPLRRALLRAELDACFFHLYLGSADAWAREATDDLRRLFSTPRDAVAYILDQFPILKQRDEKRYGEYRTARLALEAYNRMSETATGTAYRTILAPPPADSLVAHPTGAARPGAGIAHWQQTGER